MFYFHNQSRYITKKKLFYKIMLRPFFATADMLKEIFDHIPLFSMSKKNPVLDQNLS